jgi:hypothetical protein
MPDVFYPCCDVGDRIPHVDGPLKSNCWSCGDPEFIRVFDLSEDYELKSYYHFTYDGRMVRPTVEPPPWRI